jgi:D-glycero-alpha-D-manno-heptose-7-phosphate kinase
MIVIQTPLRISFVGGGTDFEDYYREHGGAVLSTAIDKAIFVIIKERFDDLICLNYSQRERVEKVEDIHHELIRESLKMTGIEKGVEITTLADIPSEGTGLGSSSSVTVGLLQALYSYQGEIRTAAELARLACQIEIERLKKPIGKQDQYIAAFGNLRLIQFSKNGVEVEKIDLPREHKRRLNESLLSFYTGMVRKADDILGEQKAGIDEHIDILGEMKKLVFKARDAIQAGAFDEFGEILHTNWELKKQLASKISNSQINEMYATALKAGALGGKITGAGGGGFLLLYCPKEKQDEVRKAIHLRELPMRFQEDGSKVIFNYRRVN